MIKKRIIADLAPSAPYLVRWTLDLPFGWSLKLHQILRADDDRCHHDHPWWFVRVILWGGYVESCGVEKRLVHRKPWRPWAPWRVYWCGQNFRHRITKLPRGLSWTVVLCGHHSGKWGFFTRDGWVPWKPFVDATRSLRVAWCDDGRTVNLDPVKQVTESP